MKISVQVRSDRPILHFILVSLLISGTGAFLYLFDPSNSLFYAPCPFHALTGLHCPGCGSLRAYHELLHGNIVAAFGLNALAISVLPYIAYVSIVNAVNQFKKQPVPEFFIPPSAVWILLSVILLFGILRNLPFHPFVLLAP